MGDEAEAPGVSRPAGLDDRDVIEAIDAGARVIELRMVVSLGLHVAQTKRRLLVRPGESVARAGAGMSAVTALFGWWGLGVFFTPIILWLNLTGGEDVTDVARAQLATDVAIAQVAAEQAAAELAAARAGPLEARRDLALSLLERGELDTAWELVGRDVTDGPLRRDFATVRKLLVSLTGRRGHEARAGLLATILRQDHGDEVTGYLASIVEKAVREADTPRDAHRPTPSIETIPGFVLFVGGILAACVAFAVWTRR